MIRIVCLFCWALILISCDPDRRRNTREQDLTFSTTDDAELYFKNIRRSYYDHENISAAKLDVYRLSERSIVQDRPVINLAIAHNWRYDEAYLLLEPNQALGNSLPLRVYWQARNDSSRQGVYHWSERDKLSQLKFAGNLNRSLKQRHRLYVLTADSVKIPLLDQPEEREVFRRTLFDYYKLTGAFK